VPAISSAPIRTSGAFSFIAGGCIGGGGLGLGADGLEHISNSFLFFYF
jgi:hypothetical protein